MGEISKDKSDVVSLSQSVVYRQVMGEFVVIQLETGKIHYFTPPAEQVLSFFASPTSIENFETAHALVENSDEKEYLKDFFKILLDEKILELKKGAEEEKAQDSVTSYLRPEFLRTDQKNLSEIVFLCP